MHKTVSIGLPLLLGLTIGLLGPPAAPLAAPPDAPELRAPIRCDAGRDCWVSTFFDHDPGPGHKDQACGPVTYDGHGGVDFAIPNLADMARGVEVLAAAAGTVIGTRDSMHDVSIRDIEPGSLGGKDCGNGVRIDHGGGWHPQYCHLKRDSIRVRSM